MDSVLIRRLAFRNWLREKNDEMGISYSCIQRDKCKVFAALLCRCICARTARLKARCDAAAAAPGPRRELKKEEYI
jgi:hypothetical protein